MSTSNNPYNIQLHIESNMEAHKAGKKPCKCTPGTIENANFSTSVLITKENKPKVIIVIGKEKNLSIGFSVAFKNPSTIDNMISEGNDAIYILPIPKDTI